MNIPLKTLIVCPKCHQSLIIDQENQRIICSHDSLAFSIKDGIPVLLEDQAQSLDKEEK